MSIFHFSGQKFQNRSLCATGNVPILKQSSNLHFYLRTLHSGVDLLYVPSKHFNVDYIDRMENRFSRGLHVLFSNFSQANASVLVTHPALLRHRCLPCSPSNAATCDRSAPPCCGPWSRRNPTRTPPRNCLVFLLPSWWRRASRCSSAATARTNSLDRERKDTTVIKLRS